MAMTMVAPGMAGIPPNPGLRGSAQEDGSVDFLAGESGEGFVSLIGLIHRSTALARRRKSGMAACQLPMFPDALVQS